MKEKIFVVSGGTGGHIIPARCVASELAKKDFEVDFFGDFKIKNYIKKPNLSFENQEFQKETNNLNHKIEPKNQTNSTEFDQFRSRIIKASQLKTSPKIFLLKAAILIGIGFLESLFWILIKKPKFVIAFGGYASFPTLFAALVLKKKIILHEQNAHLGKVNRFFANRAYKIAITFPETFGIKNEWKNRVFLTGNPVRTEIATLNQNHYQPFDFNDSSKNLIQKKFFEILIIGGSGGAKIFSDVLPTAFSCLSEDIKAKLSITQQCRTDLCENTLEQYKNFKIKSEISVFFNDMPDRIAKSDLVIARAGASSIFEFCAAKRPMILIPFANSADDHQAKNANYLKQKEAAIVIDERNFNAKNFSEVLNNLIANQSALKKLSENASKVSNFNACNNIISLIKDE